MGPGKDTHGTLGPLRRKAVGGPINAPQGEVTHNDGALKRDNRQVFRQTKSEKSFTLTIPWNLAKLVKTCHGIILRRHLIRQRQMVLLRERCAELKEGFLQYCCNPVWKKNGGRIPWSVTAICETYKISCLMGKHLMRGDSANHSTDPQFHVVRWSNITQFLPKTCQDSASSGRKFYPEISLEMYCPHGEFEKETFWSQTLRNWKGWTHQKSTLGDSMQRKC